MDPEDKPKPVLTLAQVRSRQPVCGSASHAGRKDRGLRGSTTDPKGPAATAGWHQPGPVGARSSLDTGPPPSPGSQARTRQRLKALAIAGYICLLFTIVGALLMFYTP
jgi:hypothetical protein